MKGLPARRVALDVLIKVEVNQAYANIALSSAFEKQQLSERDRAFVTFLVNGVLRHRDELDGAISKLSKQPLQKMSPVLRNVLRLGIYQLKYASDIPQSAVLNTATELGKTAGHAGIGKFVSGVLRSYLRQPSGGEPTEEISDSNSVQALSKQYSVPEWLVSRWLGTRGLEQTQQLLKFSQSVPELVVRTAESGITPEALMNIFTSNGIKARYGALVPACLIIEDRGKYKGPIDKLPGYKDGLFLVQDESASFASLVVDAKPGELVVDLCAAPGGKAIHLGEMMENKGRVIAVDVHANRLEMLKENRQRVGLTNIEAVAADGTTFDPKAPVDRVLIDAPCTGTGVINRRTDLRFKREQPDLAALVELQRKLLRNGAGMLKPGGTLVYSTCSIEPEENEQNVEWFRSEHPQFVLESLVPYVPKDYLNGQNEPQFASGEVQLLPTEHGVSGFFVAKFVKRGD